MVEVIKFVLKKIIEIYDIIPLYNKLNITSTI